MAGLAGRGAPLNLRGRLSDVYFPALLAADAGSLSRRLGDKATLDDPMFGATSGAAGIERALSRATQWLVRHGATFEKRGLVVGSDREVTEGTLSLEAGGERIDLPVAVVAEKRREREVDLRLYYSTRAFADAPSLRGSTLADENVVVPAPVAAHLDALSRADLGAMVASFERDAMLRAPDGSLYGGSSSHAPLGDYFKSLIAVGPQGGTTFCRSARADDGNACALECAVVRLRGHEVPRHGILLVYERGDSGLLRGVRLYGNID
jgi:hypothetical protein